MKDESGKIKDEQGKILSPIVIWKKIGQTPLEALEMERERRSISRDVPMTYAGRLDPLAEGALIILTGDACRSKEHYLSLDKTYTIEVLLGVSTDSGDVLGMPCAKEKITLSS